jgi:glycosyltransferase involved in cell wall biosynthesis
MKVLQVASSLYDWGGIERYISYLMEGLEELGHEVELVCPANSPLDSRATGKHHHFSLRGQFHLGAIGWFRRFFQDNRYDVVHAHYSPDYVIPVRAAKRSGIRAVIMTRHLANPWNRLKSRAYQSTFDRIVAVSDAVRESLLKDSFVDPAKVTVAKAGCPTPTIGGRGASRKKLGIEGFAAGYFGRLTVEKGVADLVEAAEALPSDSNVHIFGTGPQEQELRRLANPSRVHFHGFIPDVADAMNAMDVIVVPSTWAEAFPFSVLEAMASGRPVIGTKVGGIPEQVTDEVTGRLVPPNSPGDLAAAINWMRENAEMADAMGKKGKEVLESHYSISAFAKRMENVYEDVLLSVEGTSKESNGL